MADSPDFPADPPIDGDDARPDAAELEAAGQGAMFGDAALAVPPATPAANPAPDVEAHPYRVLARKYRPQTFDELIGQDAMVQTLANAIKRDRLAHAFLMTGVRGVGKTTTARLIAKALNCIGPDGNGGPTIDPCGVCEPCVAIAQGRHIDVIEMDAASHTGVDDVREIIDAVRYSAVSARFKIYIIDEVHMLSKNAFNALLKTLEEPPAHVKFLFATTEVDKLPVTVLSRTQRFDLRRITAPMLQAHFAKVCAAEGVRAEDEALAMIAAAAEGSVRDGLSILDQAIAHADMIDGDAGADGGGKVTADQVRDMLGLSDKGMQRRLLAAMLAGDGGALLAGIDEQYALGVEPLALVRGQMDLAHRIALAQFAKDGGADAPSAEEREAIEGWAKELGPAQVHRLWQLLLKGHDEVRTAPDPLAAVQMALMRVLHAADMPDPGSLVRRLEEMARAGPGAASGDNRGDGPTDAPAAMDWAELIDRVEAAGQLRVGQVMRDRLRLVSLTAGNLRYRPVDGFSQDVRPDLRDALKDATGERWSVEIAGEDEDAAPSLGEVVAAEAETRAEAVRSDPMVSAAKAAFPGAELLEEGDIARAGGNRSGR